MSVHIILESASHFFVPVISGFGALKSALRIAMTNMVVLPVQVGCC